MELFSHWERGTCLQADEVDADRFLRARLKRLCWRISLSRGPSPKAPEIKGKERRREDQQKGVENLRGRDRDPSETEVNRLQKQDKQQ